ncbi:hypothetical protein EV363DRAFT_1294404 [Boletus edulis]|nr:hypothetical protein EV363DRAFT_1294404 [Boletus edulis]
MRKDPFRWFAFGITVEDDTDMRIWYHSHTLLTASEPINFMTPSVLSVIIEAIDDNITLFYLVGNKMKEELGWDPTIEHIIVKVESNTYVMVGHDTQVYKAQDEHKI